VAAIGLHRVGKIFPGGVPAVRDVTLDIADVSCSSSSARPAAAKARC
jgi:hypothetical protein